jgi:uncharacterized protein YqjF (DUF2071 family)
MTRKFLTAEWRKLIMAQYAVEPKLLEPYLPAGTELDFFQGRCYVSLVGFLFDRVRVKGIRFPFHTRFEEVNLRFYVIRPEPSGGLKRGVVFIREIVPRRAIALIARRLYEEPYDVLKMSHSIRRIGNSVDVRYSWMQANKWQTLSVEALNAPRAIDPGSEEAFVTEHYWGYTKRRKGGTSQYEVRHPGWEIYPVRRHRIHVDFGWVYGEAFAHLNRQQPASVLLAEGSPVTVLTGTRLKPAPVAV